MADRKLGFRVVFAASEDTDYPAAELNYHSPQTKGWQSARYVFPVSPSVFPSIPPPPVVGGLFAPFLRYRGGLTPNSRPPCEQYLLTCTFASSPQRTTGLIRARKSTTAQRDSAYPLFRDHSALAWRSTSFWCARHHHLRADFASTRKRSG